MLLSFVNDYKLRFTNRDFHLGVAMMMIILFHITGKYGIFPLKMIFSKGFYGVDIFLFFSALGLSFSYKRNTRGVFFKKRAIRVLPAFYILILFRIAWQLLYNHKFDIGDVVITLCGLSYFKFLGGIRIDWYLSALILLYLSFPIFFTMMKELKWKGVLYLSLISSIIILSIPMHWEYQCLIGRIPIYALGIYCFLNRNTYVLEHRVFVYYLSYGFILLMIDILVPNSRTRFLAPAFFCPFLILINSWISENLKKLSYVKSFIEFIGKYTIEIYVGNVISMVVVHTGLGLRGLGGAVIDLTVNALFAYVIYRMNSFIRAKTK